MVEGSDYSDSVMGQHRVDMNFETLPTGLQPAIGKYCTYMYGLGQQIVGDVDEVKYDGRLIVLTDGSRWEVERFEASTCEFWDVLDKVVIIDDEMYNIENAEHVTVTEDD